MRRLLVCAMQRRGEPATAGELCDDAMGLAQAGGWPRRAWSDVNAQRVAALLRGMEKEGCAKRDGHKRENGREVPCWAPPGGAYDPAAPVPRPLDPGDHPAAAMTGRQRFALFDLQDELLQAHARMHRDLCEMIARHVRELAEMSARVRRELVAEGIVGDDHAG